MLVEKNCQCQVIFIKSNSCTKDNFKKQQFKVWQKFDKAGYELWTCVHTIFLLWFSWLSYLQLNWVYLIRKLTVTICFVIHFLALCALVSLHCQRLALYLGSLLLGERKPMYKAMLWSHSMCLYSMCVQSA